MLAFYKKDLLNCIELTVYPITKLYENEENFYFNSALCFSRD